MVKGAVDKERIDKKCEVTDELVLDVLTKQVKMREDSLVEFHKAGRVDLEEATEREIVILKEYLPEPLGDEEVREMITKIIEEVKPVGRKDMGKVMGRISPMIKGRYDLKKVSMMIKDQLN